MSDVKYTRPSGKEGFLNITVNPVVNQPAAQIGFLLVGEEIMEHKVLQGQLSHAQKLESIGQLAAGIAHEINTPTQYVGDNIRFLQESCAEIFALVEAYQRVPDAARSGSIPTEATASLDEAIQAVDVDISGRRDSGSHSTIA